MSDSNPPIVWDSALVSQLQQILVYAAVTCLGYGCFLILAIVTMRALIGRGLSSAAQRYLFAAVIIFLASSTVYCAGELATSLTNLALGPYNDNQSAMKLAERLHIVIAILSRIMFLLSDILVVWRAWVLARPIVQIMLASCMLVTLGFVITEMALSIHNGIFGTAFKLATTLVLYIPLVVNNLLATSVVLYKLWIYRTQIKTSLGEVSSKSQIERVLFLLIESGSIYCGWWTVLIVATYVRSVPIMVYTVIDALSPFAAAIYPMLIILVVEHQKSQAEEASAKSISHSLRFNSTQAPQQSDGQTGSTSVSIIQSIVDIQSAQRRSSHSAPRQSTSQVRSTGSTSIIQAIVNIQSARKSKKGYENADSENKTSRAPHDNDLDAVAY